MNFRSNLIKSITKWINFLPTLSSPFFGGLVETIMENTISNILTEAFNKEFGLTNRPRLIALPPKESMKPNTVGSERTIGHKTKSRSASLMSSNA